MTILDYKNALITGAAGFIGFHVSKRLLEGGHRVFGVDNLNDYYDVINGVDTVQAATAQYRPHPLVEGLIPVAHVRWVA